ncbi:Ig-like domain-containing protein, partial [Flavobacterium sp.]|uniref:Ig-like domain-containing protein n=1 Tax=Flavobacterium sp. TaxID=239 RepID=UPI0028BDBABD
MSLNLFKNKIVGFAIIAFSIGNVFAQSPGGVSTNLTLWLKANNPASITGSPVQTWTTSGGTAAGYSLNQTNVANRPLFVDGATNYKMFNYNPRLDFIRTSSTKIFNSSTTPNLLGNNGTAIVVSSQEIGNIFTYASGGRYQLKPTWRFQTGISGTGYTFDWTPPTEFSTDAGTIMCSYGCGTNMELRKNSILASTPSNVATTYNPAISNGLYLGANNSTEYADSSIAEIILFNTKLTAAEMDRVESYLSLKYGITRGGNTNTTALYNYIASDAATVFWDKSINTGFNNDIAGIGRDDNSGLNQKQSISCNNNEAVTIALGNTIALENTSNPNAFTGNLSFLTWGNNGLSNDFNNATTFPIGILERLNRVWKTQATNFNQQISVGFENSIITGMGSGSDLVLLFDEDGVDFSNATRVAACYGFNADNKIQFRGINIPAGKPYFTLARMITPTQVANNGPLCDGSTLNLTSQSLTPDTEYFWIGPNGFTSIDQNPMIPSVSSVDAGTYTVYITTQNCTTELSTDVTINPLITPNFTAVPPICSGDTLSALPTTSTDGITGIWSPDLDNTTTTTYTFTPDAGQCATSTTMTITVNSTITPTFDQVAPICNGSTLNDLPTTSNDGITGTWSPSLDNTATTTYTFTPDTGQCASTTSMMITVNTLPVITGILTVCEGLTSTLVGSGIPALSDAWISSDTSIATIDTNGILSGISEGTATITYTDENGCGTTVLVTVNPQPTISGNLSLCINDTSQLSGSDSPASSNAWITSDSSVASVDNNGLITGLSDGTAIITYTNNYGCSTDVTITVLPLPTATISGTVDVCQNGTQPSITFTGANGAAPYTFIYTINGGAPLTATTTVGNSVTVAAATATVGTFTYDLVSVSSSTTPSCSQAQTGSAIVTVLALPTATIATTTATVCFGTAGTLTFTGTPSAEVTYNDGGANQTVTLDATGNASVATPNLSAATTYTLVSVMTTGTPSCSQNLTGSVTIAVTPLPTVSISGTTAICEGNTATITFNGTPNAVVTYTVDAGTSQTISLDATGAASITTAALTATT